MTVHWLEYAMTLHELLVFEDWEDLSDHRVEWHRLCEAVDCNELLQSLDGYWIGWKVRNYDCSWHVSDRLHKREHFEIFHLPLNFVEAMIELNDTRRLLTRFVIALLTFGSLTNSAPWSERHVRQWVSFFFSCADGLWCLEVLSGVGFLIWISLLFRWNAQMRFRMVDSELTSKSISAMLWFLSSVSRTLCTLSFPTEVEIPWWNLEWPNLRNSSDSWSSEALLYDLVAEDMPCHSETDETELNFDEVHQDQVWDSRHPLQWERWYSWPLCAWCTWSSSDLRSWSLHHSHWQVDQSGEWQVRAVQMTQVQLTWLLLCR